MRYAYFVKRPRTIEDLMKPHAPEWERPFWIVKEIILNPMDYENFKTDMLADRQFLEDNFRLCSESPICCLFIRKVNSKDGIAAIPNCIDGSHIAWAAYISEK